MFKKTVLLAVAVISCFTVRAFAAENETLLRLGTNIPADDNMHEINVIFQIPVTCTGTFSISLYNVNCTDTIAVEDFVITEVNK